MPSLFSRARTTSTNHKSLRPQIDSSDEFGRVTSRGSARGTATVPGKKDKNPEKTRIRTLSSPKARPPGAVVSEEEPVIPDGSFFPLNLEPPPSDLASPSDSERGPREREQDYGYLSYHRHVVLGLEEVDRLVRIVTEELSTRGLTTPFLFSSLALDVNSSGVRRLIQAFLRTCVAFPALDAERTWRDEARFAAPPELAMFLRWGLARILRVSGGHAVRGLISWDMYVDWSEAELAQDYPTTHFKALIAQLEQHLQVIIINVLSLLARLTAHSSSSGHTPPTLSPLFGPLIFGLGPAALPFHHTYLQYLRATNAMEHVLLSFVRWQDAPSNESSGSFGGGPGSASSLGVPTRLKDWIRGYPAMLPDPATRSRSQDRLQPRRGARTVRVVSVRRNVRMYTPDLIKSAASWASRPAGVTGHAPNVFAQSRDWERVAPPTLRLTPRYADSFKKRMDLPPNFHPHTGVASSNASIASSATVSSVGDSPTDYFGLGKPALAGEERFRNLTDLKWGEFEAMGFGGLDPAEKKLQFDLTESARTSRAAKRATLTWTDFSSSGFSRTDAPLSATLQFSSPLVNSISSWPEQQADITRKLKKTQKSLPPFGWDTEPVMGTEAVIEESFVDVFCDLVYGGGWMDIEREEVDRECNWTLIEFKSLPIARSTVSGGTDPRTSTTVFLFEEFVPLEYRQQLSAGATTLNGRPYVVGHVPRGLNSREVEFEGLLRGNNSSTKIISLGRDGPVKRDVTHSDAFTSRSQAPAVPPSSALLTPVATRTPRPEDISSPLFVAHREAANLRPSTPTTPAGSATKRRFRLPSTLTPNSRTSGLTPSVAEDIDFETRLASYSDDELNSINTNMRKLSKHERRRSKDDAWVDILVASHDRRATNQDAEIRRPGGPRSRNVVVRPDPEVASQEVAQVLAGVRGPSPPFEGDSEADIEPMQVPHRSKMNNRGTTPLDDSYEPTIPESEGQTEADEEELEEEIVLQPSRRLGYFDLHPERRPAHHQNQDEDILHELHIRAPVDNVVEPPRRSDVTESVYSSSGSTPPASPKLTPTPDLRVATTTATTPQSPPQPPQPTPSPQTPTYQSPKDLQRQQEVRDRLSGKPGPKAGALIEMYRERERQAAGGAGSSNGNSNGSSPSKVGSQKSTLTVKEEAALPATPEPEEAEPGVEIGSLSPEPEVAAELMEPPSLDLDQGRSSPYRYVHGAPLHNVVEEEEED
ncbi:hypothetical protein EDB92DRAFT_1942827 [Lactarius akahatsu]|uniref:Meiotically up-regulated protein Msb1/Mug8 domain-containing protein n=1 Tax=Lactarius akahatsu TaxID=416441 RepID=A0AAD4QFR3_9AGAM|nr:hypothetical protein EDB92DRAFT_1942827 [Lactarius akahatsu]